MSITKVVKTTKEEFSLAVEKLVVEKGMEYMEAIIHEANTRGLELEIIPKLINQGLKASLEVESMALNLIEKQPQLPIE
jgi:hypothetical protein